MPVLIKPLKGSGNKFSVNGKLCVLLYGANKKVCSMKHSLDLTDHEREKFMEYMKNEKII